jgi:type I restriction enzyme S subunit
MMRFNVDPKKVNPRFLVDQFRSQYMKRQIATSAKPAVNQSSINQTDVKSFMVRLPPIELQNRYAKIVGAKDRAAQRLRGAVGAAKDLFAALSQRAFAGDL